MEKVLRVLVIDDAHFVRELIKRAMEKKPDDEFIYEVVKESETGKEGIIDYFKMKPDFVVLDLSLPDMDGFDAMKQILSKEPNAKIIAMSEDYSDSIKEKALANGATHYVPKPFQNAFLWNGVDVIVKQLREEGYQFPYESSEKELYSEVVWEEVSESHESKNNESKESVIVISSSEEDEEDELFAITPQKTEQKPVVILENAEFEVVKESESLFQVPKIIEESDNEETINLEIMTKDDNDIQKEENDMFIIKEDKIINDEKIKKDEHIIKHNKNIIGNNVADKTYDIGKIETSDVDEVNLEGKEESPSEEGQAPLEPVNELISEESSYNELTKDNGSPPVVHSIRPPRDKVLKQMYEEQYRTYPKFYDAEDVKNPEENADKNKTGLFSSLRKIFQKK
ncbi:response regulator [Bacillus mobilis]|uniref:response regulator n=1 Tax=Bacillus mobilis TaxID=2026190 RepID=UPI002E23C7DB|nr:response regulator [Bacillus mobilis]